MAVAYSDSLPTRYAFHGGAKPVLSGQSITRFIMEKPHTGMGYCLNMLLACLRKRMSALSLFSVVINFENGAQSQYQSQT